MIDKSLLKALFPGSILTFLLFTGILVVFVPLILIRLFCIILLDLIYPPNKNQN